jgi:hypothetical protein
MQLQYLLLILFHLPSLLCLLSLVLVMSLFDTYEDFPKLVPCPVCMCPLLTGERLCMYYCSCWKSIDLINLENACEYFATKSLFAEGRVPPLVFIKESECKLSLHSESAMERPTTPNYRTP